jgi:hypothetical protein
MCDQLRQEVEVRKGEIASLTSRLDLLTRTNDDNEEELRVCVCCHSPHAHTLSPIAHTRTHSPSFSFHNLLQLVLHLFSGAEDNCGAEVAAVACGQRVVGVTHCTGLAAHVSGVDCSVAISVAISATARGLLSRKRRVRAHPCMWLQ